MPSYIKRGSRISALGSLITPFHKHPQTRGGEFDLTLEECGKGKIWSRALECLSFPPVWATAHSTLPQSSPRYSYKCTVGQASLYQRVTHTTKWLRNSLYPHPLDTKFKDIWLQITVFFIKQSSGCFHVALHLQSYISFPNPCCNEEIKLLYQIDLNMYVTCISFKAAWTKWSESVTMAVA